MLKLIAHQNKNLPVIAQSAFSFEEERENALKHGCDEYVTKPLNVEELMEKINYVFQ